MQRLRRLHGEDVDARHCGQPLAHQQQHHVGGDQVEPGVAVGPDTGADVLPLPLVGDHRGRLQTVAGSPDDPVADGLVRERLRGLDVRIRRQDPKLRSLAPGLEADAPTHLRPAQPNRRLTRGIGQQLQLLLRSRISGCGPALQVVQGPRPVLGTDRPRRRERRSHVAGRAAAQFGRPDNEAQALLGVRRGAASEQQLAAQQGHRPDMAAPAGLSEQLDRIGETPGPLRGQSADVEALPGPPWVCVHGRHCPRLRRRTVGDGRAQVQRALTTGGACADHEWP